MYGRTGSTLSLTRACKRGVPIIGPGMPQGSFLCLGIAGVNRRFLFFNFPAPKAQIFMGVRGPLPGVQPRGWALPGQANNAGHVIAGRGFSHRFTLLALPISMRSAVMCAACRSTGTFMAATGSTFISCFSIQGSVDLRNLDTGAFRSHTGDCHDSGLHDPPKPWISSRVYFVRCAGDSVPVRGFSQRVEVFVVNRILFSGHIQCINDSQQSGIAAPRVDL